ncbi:preprotein translocase subunit SecG [Oleisolibacter albus]|uniref:preprotein translocase subunit SecG n=1 Tax=Oleisolibacter albus TaxID=2171757 RepID=UPI000DF2E42F|nr:preprotein translocase subunit SecG [Oleisolibacter albus]
METVLLVIHLLIAAALVGVVLIQKSEGGGLGLGGGTMGGLMTARGSANLLTRTTAILAGLFFCTSLILAIMASHGRTASSVFDQTVPATAPAAPGAAAPTTDAPPATPAQPSVPVGQ